MIHFNLSLSKESETETETKGARKYAELYSTMEDMYFTKAANSDNAKKMQQYRARAVFSHVAYTSLRNSNSSSILERSFSDCLRSLADKRVKLRNVFECLFYEIIIYE